MFKREKWVFFEEGKAKIKLKKLESIYVPLSVSNK
jgi:hypothetical protein